MPGLLTMLLGDPLPVPDDLLRRFPELAGARLRRGGLPVRVAGWCLGQASAAGLTLWKTVFIGRRVVPDADLLLHELRHVQQYQEHPALFPIRYLWASVRHGYHENPYEADARAFARDRLSGRARGGAASAPGDA